MPFDGSVTYAVCREINRKLTGARVDKIYQPENEEIVLTLRADGHTERLLLSAAADSARLQLSALKPETPMSPPAFCMLLRKHFEDARFLGAVQANFDRIVFLDFEKMNELGDLTRRRLVLEMMGKHSNLIIVREDGMVLDAVRHVGAGMSSVRTVVPGVHYELPSHNHKENPLELSGEDRFLELIGSFDGPLEKGLYLLFNGLCPLSAREILCLAGLDERSAGTDLSEEDRHALYRAFCSFFLRLSAAEDEFTLYRGPDGRVIDYSVFPYLSLSGTESERFPSAGALLDAYFSLRVKKSRLEQKAGDISHLLGTNLERVRKKIALQEEQLLEAKDREDDRRKGDLITANLYQLKEGMSRVRLWDYYQDPPVEVELVLDSRLSPNANAQRFYSRYNKKKRTEEAVTGQLAASRQELSYLESLENALRLADCEADLENLRVELGEAGYLKKSRKKSKNLAASKPLSFTTSEGIRVLVGKNNLQNDALTFRQSRPYDLWLHVKDAPGSHTVLLVDGKEKGLDYTDQSIIEAAQLAAAHSSLGSGKCAVDATFIRYVKKPSGAAPGFVTYTHQTTLYVSPSA